MDHGMPGWQMAPASSWADDYPLHRAAVEGSAQLLRELIAEGHNPAAPDSDSWTPLHYAAWLHTIDPRLVLSLSFAC